MPPVLAHLAAVLLLIAQACIGIAPGKVLCIPVGDCATHEALFDHHHDHHDHDHDHGPVDPARHHHDDCGCHLHVPLPDDHQAPSKLPCRVDASLLVGPAAPMPLVEIPRDPAPQCPDAPRAHPPDVRDQTLSLRATRLLI